jgi:hypothetical protein
MTTKIAGRNGYETSGYEDLMIKTVIYPETPIIVPFPSIIIIHPIIAADPNLPACLMIRKKAAMADGQKDLL